MPHSDDPVSPAGVDPEWQQPPVEAAEVFGPAFPLVVRYARLLAGEGVLRGLIGPREPARLWDRHLLNCAALSDAAPANATVVDVGSGAGLPGIVLALRRPDLRVRLVEPLARRTSFLTEAVVELDLTARVEVVRGRAEEPSVRAAVGGADVVTARAVAPLDRLVGWCLPLLRPGGRLALIKGATAGAELTRHAAAIRRLGGTAERVVVCRAGSAEVSVVVVERDRTRGRR